MAWRHKELRHQQCWCLSSLWRQAINRHPSKHSSDLLKYSESAWEGEMVKGHPGGHHWDCQPGSLSFKQVNTNSSKLRSGTVDFNGAYPVFIWVALLALCAVNSPLSGEFLSQRTSNADFGVSLMWVRIGYSTNSRMTGDVRLHDV